MTRQQLDEIRERVHAVRSPGEDVMLRDLIALLAEVDRLTAALSLKNLQQTRIKQEELP